MALLPMGWVLSPAYDLLNVKIILPKDKEEMALLLGGKKFNFNRAYFTRFGTALGLNEKQVQTVYKRIDRWLSKAIDLIDISFLNEKRKIEYKKLITERVRL
jgi:serine/threonine-protein kinase HipA